VLSTERATGGNGEISRIAGRLGWLAWLAVDWINRIQRSVLEAVYISRKKGVRCSRNSGSTIKVINRSSVLLSYLTSGLGTAVDSLPSEQRVSSFV
jgi:hypothetical protein